MEPFGSIFNFGIELEPNQWFRFGLVLFQNKNFQIINAKEARELIFSFYSVWESKWIVVNCLVGTLGNIKETLKS